ncbi:MAG: Gfo/Idh/MocA family oxidoreductase [Verrucomicrobiota bacterium]
MLRRTFITGMTAAVAVSAAPAARSTPLKIGQIGTTHSHASGKLTTIRDLPELWSAVGWVESDPRRASAAKAKKPYNGVPLLKDEQELLGMKEVAAVIVETGIEEACATALRALKAGKHVHLDKPGALDHEEFKALHREAATRGLTIQMGYMLRYNPAFELLLDVVRQGWIGEVLEIEASMGKKIGDAERANIKALPGGAMFELGCHPIDIIVTLLGKPARVKSISTPSRSDGTHDHQLAILEYPRASAAVRINLSDPFGNERRRFAVSGTEGAVEILPMESGSVSLWFSQNRGAYKRGKQTVSLPSKGGRYTGEFIDLAKIVRGEKSLAWTGAHDIIVHETLLRASGVWA